MSGTYTLEALVRAAGISPRTARYYFERRVLPAPVHRGMHTTYTEEHLIQLKAIRRLRRVERLGLDAIRARLAASSVEETRTLAGVTSIERPGVATVPIPKAEASAPATQANPDLSAGVRTMAINAPVEPTSGGQMWERIELLPGLELHVKPDAGALIQRLAREIRAHYAVATLTTAS